MNFSWIKNNEKQEDLEHEMFEDFKRKPEKRKSLLLQYAAAIIASISTAGYGIICAWTSPSLPHLTSLASEFSVSVSQAAWIASLSGFGLIMGYLLNTLLIDRLGRKRTLLYLAIPQIVSWILIYLGKHWIILCSARVIGGIGYGGGLCATTVYIGEIGDENTRGIFLTFIKMSLNIGIFVTMILGAFLSYNAMNLALLGIPIIFIISFSYMPDSNQFYPIDIEEEEKEGPEDTVDDPKEKTMDVLQENTVDVLIGTKVCLPNESRIDVLKENRHNDTTNINQDLIEIMPNGKQDSIEEKTNLLYNKNNQNESQKNILWRLFFLRNNQKALLIILVAALTDTFSGHMAIVSYTQQIFEYSGASLKAEYAAIVLSALKIAASLISTLVVERFKRRFLFLSTGLLAGFAQGLVGLFFFLKMYLKVDVSYITWLPLFGLSMYEVVGGIGFSNLFFVYQGELFSDDVKGVGVTCTNIAYESFTFFIKFHFQMVIDALGIYALFWGFGVCSVVGTGLIYWITPETKGKSLKEIQNLLRGSRQA